MRKRIRILLLILSIIPYLFINTKAFEKTLDDYLMESFYVYSPAMAKFNYLYINKNEIDDLEEKMINFPSENNINNALLKFSIYLKNDKYLNITYSIKDNKGEYLYYSIDNTVFLLITNTNRLEYTSIDLRNDDNLTYILKKENANKTYESNEEINIDTIYNNFLDYFKFDYINVVNIIYNEEEKTYPINNAPSLTTLIDNNRLSDNEYEFVIGEYNNTIAGNYDFNICTLDEIGSLYIHHYYISIFDGNSIYCDDVSISYKKSMNSKYYKDNYIHTNINGFDKSKLAINSSYFYGGSRTVGEYDVDVEYIDDDYYMKTSGLIRVIDDISPIITGPTIIEDKLSNNSQLSTLFNYTAYDEIDGDLTNKISLEDLDSYLDNINTPGEYRFLIKVSDNSGNIAKRNIKYILVDDVSNNNIEEDKNEDEKNQDNIENSNNNDESNSNIDNNEELVDNNDNDVSNLDNNQNETIIEPNPNNDLIIKTNTDNILSENDIRKKLLFYGLINDDFEGEILSDYFGNENESGEYQVIVLENGNRKYYSLIVEASEKKKEEISNTTNDNNNIVLIVIFSIITGLLLSVIIVILIIMKKKKLNK